MPLRVSLVLCNKKKAFEDLLKLPNVLIGPFSRFVCPWVHGWQRSSSSKKRMFVGNTYNKKAV
jgi:hypothetical protein